MNVITPNGLKTSLKWWDKLYVSGQSVVLESARGANNQKILTMTVAKCKTKLKAEALFEALNEGIRVGKENFSVEDWNKGYARAAANAAEDKLTSSS